ncbi:glycosyltransferase [Magnetospirillum sp. SS-4]|uniref:glycosyltransferase n=1 Tax=Magnetospirillum sp. SS-4 TaxID=2681465 RepID=UPI00137FFCCB|nr:glycosyltransferase [Magnetospirillum sp. SS-4]CAA7624135.1 hypothetical protein MTBSS4_430014 [Magnetospirillum sp. SS-4]
MPPIASANLAAVFEDVLSGRRRLVVWGARDATAANLWQCPLPRDYVVDANRQLWGTRFHGLPVRAPAALRNEAPDRIAVLIHDQFGEHLDRVAAFLDDIGSPDSFTPVCLGEAGASLDSPPSGGHSLGDLVTAPVPPANRIEHAWALWRAASAEDHWDRARRILARFRGRTRRMPPSGAAGKAVLMIERMQPGGAERQICNLAIGLRRRGWNVVLATMRPEAAGAEHYLRSVLDAGVRHVVVPPALPDADDLGPALVAAKGAEITEILWHIPGFLLPPVIAMHGLLDAERPDIVACHLDRPNVIGAVAAILAGVPSVLMSGRNVNPTRLPHFYKGQDNHFRRLYRLVLGLPGIVLAANSRHGASSYAEWLETAPTDIPVIANGLLEVPPPHGRNAAPACRRQMGLPAGGKVVLGIFRLAPEKRPLIFVEVFARLRRVIPDLLGVICGDGMLETQVAERIEALGLTGILRLAPSSPDVPALIGMADLLLHVAEVEGTPNVILEAQGGGLPVISTLAGGTGEILAPDLLALATDPDDVDGLERNALRLLTDDVLRRRLGRRAADHMRRRHSLETLASETLAALDH